MTLETLFTGLVTHKPVVLSLLFFAPWLALGLCVAIPGRREEPFVLNFNLGMACLSLLLAVGYLIYATSQGGWARVVEEADILLMLAPCYYVAVSLWVTQQRLPLEQVAAYRVVQGLALVGIGYLGISWFFSKLRFFIFSYLLFPLLVLLLLGFVGVMYFGYLRLTGKDTAHTTRSQHQQATGHRPARRRAQNTQKPVLNEIDEELDRLKRQLKPPKGD